MWRRGGRSSSGAAARAVRRPRRRGPGRGRTDGEADAKDGGGPRRRHLGGGDGTDPSFPPVSRSRTENLLASGNTLASKRGAESSSFTQLQCNLIGCRLCGARAALRRGRCI